MTGRSHRRLRAPTADGEALIDPPLSEAAKLIEQNRQTLGEFDRSAGFSPSMRQTARLQCLEMAAFHLGQEKPRGIGNEAFIVTGHQPELFHPGVWLKNFLASSIARAMSGRAINLIVDSDFIRDPSIRVPTRTIEFPKTVQVPFDAKVEEIPWQCRDIADENVLRRFSSEVHRVYDPLRGRDKRQILLDQLWPFAVVSLEHQKQNARSMLRDINRQVGAGGIEPDPAMITANLGKCLAFARLCVEAQSGLQVGEFLLHGVGFGDIFLPFARHLLARHQEFHEIYNAVLAEYRVLHRVRNRAQPIPDLQRYGEWYEAPLWLIPWSKAGRARVFVRQCGDDLELSDRAGHDVRIQGDRQTESKDQALNRLSWELCLRPRALITTMFARLVLSDLFIHGIGGAKYDEVTDEIIRRFFGIEPPKYITATATFRLPIERPHVTIEDVREVRQKLRDVRYRPENLLRDPLTKQIPGLREQLQALADEKREYVRTHDLRRCKEQVFARLDTINRAMHELLKPVEQELHAQHSQLEVDLRRAELLGSREFSFVLFPADELPERLLALSKVSA